MKRRDRTYTAKQKKMGFLEIPDKQPHAFQAQRHNRGAFQERWPHSEKKVRLRGWGSYEVRWDFRGKGCMPPAFSGKPPIA